MHCSVKDSKHKKLFTQETILAACSGLKLAAKVCCPWQCQKVVRQQLPSTTFPSINTTDQLLHPTHPKQKEAPYMNIL